MFNFDLNESLWFKKGQEVDEIMGISLEPEISIQEFDDFVSIRGVIELKGEYFQVKEASDEEDQVLSFRDHPSQRFIDRVDSYEDGVNEFFHSFPVEISIPKYRINSTDDILVGIDSFDYELPENSQLLLNASVSIHGVKEDKYQTPGGSLEVDREEVVEPDTYDYPMESSPIEPPPPPAGESFSFDVKEKAEPEEEKEEARKPFEDAIARDEPELEVEPEQETDREEVVASEEQEESVEKPAEKEKSKKKKKSQSFAEFFAKPQVVIKDEADIEESSSIESGTKKKDVVSIHGYDNNAYYQEDDDNLDGQKEERTKDDTTYLLNIFEDKEERYSSMKMCIVQEQDTLESLAEKYDVSPFHITRTNRLEDDSIAAGQILYIPVHSHAKR